MRSYWIGVSSAFVVGGLVGYLTGRTHVEADIRKEYEESAASYRRAMEMIRNHEVETPAPSEEELIEEEIELDISKFETNEVARPDVPATNPYHKAVEAIETPVEMFVDGGINDYGVSYIEEEEYHEEDARFKGQITIVMDEHNPTFFMDGIQIDDWDQRIGDSILVDFYKLVPPGVDPVLYVRNHRTDEDYEVIREVP